MMIYILYQLKKNLRLYSVHAYHILNIAINICCIKLFGNHRSYTIDRDRETKQGTELLTEFLIDVLKCLHSGES